MSSTLTDSQLNIDNIRMLFINWMETTNQKDSIRYAKNKEKEYKNITKKRQQMIKERAREELRTTKTTIK